MILNMVANLGFRSNITGYMCVCVFACVYMGIVWPGKLIWCGLYQLHPFTTCVLHAGECDKEEKRAIKEGQCACYHAVAN